MDDEDYITSDTVSETVMVAKTKYLCTLIVSRFVLKLELSIWLICMNLNNEMFPSRESVSEWKIIFLNTNKHNLMLQPHTRWSVPFIPQYQ